jgi:hypothetical protein
MTAAIFRWRVGGLVSFSLGLAVAGALATPVRADEQAVSPSELKEQQQRQAQVREETERAVRRWNTLLRALAYHRLDAEAEMLVLQEISQTLHGLSQQQMREIIESLEAAAAATDRETAEQGVRQAREKHQEVLEKLRSLLARYEAVRSLEQAADRLEQFSRQQMELRHKGLETAAWPAGGEGSRRLPRHPLQEQAGQQAELQRSVSGVFRQLDDLRAQLPADHQERLRQAENLVYQSRLMETMKEAAEQLQRQEASEAAKKQWQAVGDLREVARALRPEGDRQAALRQAALLLDQAVSAQERLLEQAESRTPADAGSAAPSKPAAAALAKDQGKNRLLGRDSQSALQPHEPALAERLRRADKAMQQAEQALWSGQPRSAVPSQERALADLRAVRREVETLLRTEEQRQRDLQAIWERHKEAVARLLAGQREVRQRTVAAEAGNAQESFPCLASKQEDLARRSESLGEQPAFAEPPLRDLLGQAQRAMDEAAQALDARRGGQAVARQEQAIAALEQLQEQLHQKAAEAAQRRQEMARLEEAARQLEELARQERDLSADAAEAAQQHRQAGPPSDPKAEADSPMRAQAKALAERQQALQQKTEDVQDELDASLPQAAARLAEAAQMMDQARRELDKPRLSEASQKAAEAAEKLAQARQEVVKALEQIRAWDISEQAAMLPQEVRLAQAARQLAKALEQTQEAAQSSQQAAQASNQASPPASQERQPTLAELQRQLAAEARQANLREASRTAERAARDLAAGDFRQALQNQRNALAQFQDAATPDRQSQPAASSSENSPALRLAESQRLLMEATQQALRSLEASEGARAAVGQAQAQSPQAVQSQLDGAGRQLQQAEQQLAQGRPQPASQAQQQAARQLEQALQALNHALAQMGQPQVAPGQQPLASAGQQSPAPSPQGSQRGQQPGTQQAQQGQQERSDARGEGNRLADGSLSQGQGRLKETAGEGLFLYLPPRQRDLIRQALSDRLPPEFASAIQQYYRNIGQGKPAVETGSRPPSNRPDAQEPSPRK